ncbi:hypothetical protein [Sulfurimonas sp.]|uniref:hypothetical protein n=1 Tax=Sulfurimonas sp. TaxID=2022749 RepID=UPI003D0A9D34
MKILLFIFFITATLGLAYIDNDIDGVEDAYDQCLQTPLSDLVDFKGCSLNTNSQMFHYDIVFGMGFSQTNYTLQEKTNTITSYIQSDFYFDKTTLQIVASRYYSKVKEGDENGWDDTTFTVFHQLYSTDFFHLNFLTALIFPTYKNIYHNEALDYKVGFDFRYILDDTNSLFGGYSYTAVNDSDFQSILYQDTQAFDIKFAHTIDFKKTYTLSYTFNESIYKSIPPIQTVGIGYAIDINEHWFVGGYYDYGLSTSASQHAFSLSVGYFY